MGKSPIEYTKLYAQGFRKLSISDQYTIRDTIEFFREYQDHETIRNHSLREQPEYIRSLTVRDDLRILLQIRQDNTILLLNVGDHERVYGKL